MNKIYSRLTCFFVALCAMVSCSDETNLNTGDAKVAFAETEYSIKENKGLFYIPINVIGEQNGPVELTVSVSSDDPNCKEDVNFLITSKTITINAKKKTASIEIKAIDDRKINDDRKFTLHIESAKGASISSTNGTTNVTIADNDNIPYERMAGTWTVSAINLLTESGAEPISWDMNLNIVVEDNPEYGSLITATPWAVFDGSIPVFDEEGTTLQHTMTFHHNETTGKTTVDMKMGSIMANNLDFGKGQDGTDLSSGSVRSATMGISGLNYSATITGVVNSDFNEITFSNPIYLIVYSTAGNPYMYYGGFDNIKLRLKE